MTKTSPRKSSNRINIQYYEVFMKALQRYKKVPSPARGLGTFWFWYHRYLPIKNPNRAVGNQQTMQWWRQLSGLRWWS